MKSWNANNPQGSSQTVDDSFGDWGGDDSYFDDAPLHGPNAGSDDRSFARGTRIPGTNLTSTGIVRQGKSMSILPNEPVPADLPAGTKAVQYDDHISYQLPNGTVIRYSGASASATSDRSETVLGYDAKVQAGTLEKFLKEYRNPGNYQPESPSSNRGRQYEGN